MIKLTKFRSTTPLSRETFAQMTSAGWTTNDLPKSFKRRFSRDNCRVADRRRVSGLSVFFQWRRSAVGTDWQQVWFKLFQTMCPVSWDSNFLIFISLLFIIS